MTSTSTALQRLLLTLDEPVVASSSGPWRWRVRQRMASVREGLVQDHERSSDGWLSARSGAVLRERDALMSRLAALGVEVLESPDLDRLRSDLRRLALDVGHHCQRLHDLVYDEVELELGGSE